MRKLGIYVHIPFCVRKCLYCDFLSFTSDTQSIGNYVNRLCLEIMTVPVECHDNLAKNQAKNDEEFCVDTIYIGGGTPSVLSSEQIELILCKLRERFTISFDAEISIEVNPGTVNQEKLFRYRLAGINRLSIGLQSASNEELRKLGRIHTFEDFAETYRLAREAGFHNINVDLMSAIPNQTLNRYSETLKVICQMAPEHISAYSLIVEPGTPFADMKLQLPDEDTEREMYYQTKQILAAQGYDRYEISNYSKEGYECRHNVGYWTDKEYLGLGLGASSMISHVRFRNTERMEEYMHTEGSLRREVYTLSVSEQTEEFMFLGLRLMRGVSPIAFKERFGVNMEDVYGEVLKKSEEQGLLRIEKERIFLTDYGTDVSNYVFRQFLADE